MRFDQTGEFSIQLIVGPLFVAVILGAFAVSGARTNVLAAAGCALAALVFAVVAARARRLAVVVGETDVTIRSWTRTLKVARADVLDVRRHALSGFGASLPFVLERRGGRRVTLWSLSNRLGTDGQSRADEVRSMMLLD